MTFKQVYEKDKITDWEIFLSRHRELPPLYANLIISSQYPKKHLQKSIGVDFAFRRYKRVGNEYFWSIKERESLRAFLDKKQTKDYLYFRKVVDNTGNLLDQITPDRLFYGGQACSQSGIGRKN